MNRAISRGALDEYEAKRLLAAYGVPVVEEERVLGTVEALRAAERLCYPVVLKACGAEFAHKTERDLVKLDLRDAESVRDAARQLLAATRAGKELLVQRMVRGPREFMAGMYRDAQFGPVVTFGLGGIFTEALDDIALRLCPIDSTDAEAMLAEIRAQSLLGPVRGLPRVDTDALVRVIEALARLAIERPEIAEIDINPLVIVGSSPVAVDAFVRFAET